MEKARIMNGDCLELLKTMADNSIDSIVTDPPYEFGFMGKSWDSTGIAYNVELWKECLRVLKHGGHLLSFGGSRTYHRMACAIEDAGFEIRDMIEWIYGSGFPKSLNVGKAIDAKLGNEREISGVGKAGKGFNKVKGFGVTTTKGGEATTEWETTKGTSDWEGWGTAVKPAHEPICMARKPLEGTVADNCLKWGTGGINIDGTRIMTKDQEISDAVYKRLSYLYSLADTSSLPVLLCRDYFQRILSALNSYNTTDKAHLHNDPSRGDSQPLDVLCAQTIALNLFPNGVWCVQNYLLTQDFQSNYPAYYRSYGEQLRMILTAAQENSQKLHDVLSDIYSHLSEQQHIQPNQDNDHPSNLDDFLQFVSSLFLFTLHKYTKYLSHPQIVNSRFPANFIHDGSDEVVAMFPNTQSGTINPLKHIHKGGKGNALSGSKDGTLNNFLPTQNYESNSGSASRFFMQCPMDLDEYDLMYYCAKASKSERNAGLEGLPLGEPPASARSKPANGRESALGEPRANFHPTVKPIALMRYLCRLVTPKGGTVLDPFAGSGTTGVGAKLEGFGFIGIEQEADYVQIAQARINHWQDDAPVNDNQLTLNI